MSEQEYANYLLAVGNNKGELQPYQERELTIDEIADKIMLDLFEVRSVFTE